MVFPVYGGKQDGTDGPEGYTYGIVLVRDADLVTVRARLREVRFSGWIAPPENGWLPLVAAAGAGTVAAGRRGVVELASCFETALAIRVRDDRQLLLAMWAEGEEVGRYLSDPSREPDADEDVLAMVYGEEHAYAFAAACDREEAAEELAELLGEELDPERMIESERLARVLRLLGLPTWLVAAAALPKDVPTGPARGDLTRLGAGLPGVPGLIAGRAAEVIRKRRRPPPAVTDPPRGGARMDPWLM